MAHDHPQQQQGGLPPAYSGATQPNSGAINYGTGYSDADLEMGALEDKGRRWRNRYGRRGLGGTCVETLRAGWIVAVACKSKATGESYEARMRAVDEDDLGPCDFRYSVDQGASWYLTAREAYEAERQGTP